jgi:uncharacterized protein YuzE
MMKITYDQDVDAMYIQLIEGDHQCRTVCLNEEVALDFDARERLVGIEILDAKRVIGKGKLPRVLVDSLALTKGAGVRVPAARVRASRTTVKSPVKSPGRLRKAG